MLAWFAFLRKFMWYIVRQCTQTAWEVKKESPAKRRGGECLAERLSCKPPEAWAFHLPRMPHGPVILLFRNAGIAGHRLSFRPAGQVIEGVNCGRRTSLKPRRAVRVTQRAQIEQHRHASPGLAGMDESPAQKRVPEPMGPVGWVGDNVLGQWGLGFQEVVAPCPVASVDQVGVPP